MAKIFTSGLPSNIPANSQHRHEARLIENKTQKFTYIDMKDGSGWRFESRVEKVSSHFTNEDIVPGFDPIRGLNTNYLNQQTAGWSEPDKKAYSGYLNGGWITYVDNYEYAKAVFSSIR